MDSSRPLGADELQHRWRWQARPYARIRLPSAADRHRGTEGPGHLYFESLLRGYRPQWPGVFLGSEARVGSQPPVAQASPGDQAPEPQAGDLKVPYKDLGPARLRRGSLRVTRYGTVPGLPDRRRRQRIAGAEGRHRLAERARARLHLDRWKRGGQGDLVYWEGRHDGHLLQWHTRARRGNDRGRGVRGDHPDRAEHLLLSLLSLQRTHPPPGWLHGRGHRCAL